MPIMPLCIKGEFYTKAVVVCHTLPLFGKSPVGIISFDFLYDPFTRALPMLLFPVLSAFTLTPSIIS